MTEKPALPPAPDLSGAPHSDLHEALRDLQASATWKVRPSQQLIDRIVAGCRLLASQDMEQRAGFVMVPPKDSEQLRLAVRAVKQTLFSGGSSVALPADSWIERAFIAGMLAAAPPIEALEGGKTDLGASGALGASGDKGAQA